MIYADGLDFNPDDLKGNKPMRLLKKMSPQVTKDSQYILPVVYAGVLKDNKIKIKSTFNKPLIVSNGIKLEGDTK